MLAVSPNLTVGEALANFEQTSDMGSMCLVQGESGCGSGLLDADAAIARAAGLHVENLSRAPFTVPPKTIEGGCEVTPIEGAHAAGSILAALLLLLSLLAFRCRR